METSRTDSTERAAIVADCFIAELGTDPEKEEESWPESDLMERKLESPCDRVTA
jgi:hypothetical protein